MNNGCDLTAGPCACGAWHSEKEIADLKKFGTAHPSSKNEVVVRMLNEYLRLGKGGDYVRRLRDGTIFLQGTPFADSGMPFLQAVAFLEKEGKL